MDASSSAFALITSESSRLNPSRSLPMPPEQQQCSTPDRGPTTRSMSACAFGEGSFALILLTHERPQVRPGRESACVGVGTVGLCFDKHGPGRPGLCQCRRRSPPPRHDRAVHRPSLSAVLEPVEVGGGQQNRPSVRLVRAALHVALGCVVLQR